MSERRLKNEWTVHAYDKVNQEWTSATNQSYEHISDSQQFTPATPAKITPSRRKGVRRDHKTIGIISDMQVDYRRVINHETQENELVPLHDERAMRLARLILKDIQPDFIYNLGDTIDLASLSRFSPDSDHFHATLGPSFQRIHDYYAELRADNPDAEITEVDSNHNIRLKNYMLKHAPQLYNLHRAGEQDDYPALSYPYLANLKHLDVNWVGGYGAAEINHSDDLILRHGTKAVKGSTTTAVLRDDSDINSVQGHIHRAESMYRTDRRGRVIGAHAVAALCRTDGVVPSFGNGVGDDNMPVHRQENWQQGMGVIKDYDGTYEMNHVLFHPDGSDLRAFYDGKEYRSE